MAVQIVRFKDGLDIITDINPTQADEMELSAPMMFEIRNQNLLLQQWIPMALIKNDNVRINKSEILCTMEPNDDFKDYYVNAINDLKKEMKNMKNKKNSVDSPDVVEALAELSNNKDINIH
jgi:hypothetical protein